MFASQILRIIAQDHHMSSIFKGVYSKDKLPPLSNTTSDCAYILNSAISTSLGEHWLLAMVNNRKHIAIWVDPYGFSPLYYGKEFSEWLLPMKVRSSDLMIQSPTSHYCGLFVLYFYYYLSRGVDLTLIQASFSVKNLPFNDSVVAEFFWKHFKFDVRKEIVGWGEARKLI